LYFWKKFHVPLEIFHDPLPGRDPSRRLRNPGLVVGIPSSHSDGPGSFPGIGKFLCRNFYLRTIEKVYNLETCLIWVFSFFLVCSLTQELHMSQAFEEIWHFWKCLGNSRYAWIFLNCLGICRKCYLFDNVSAETFSWTWQPCALKRVFSF
jgi:hypothetical protein